MRCLIRVGLLFRPEDLGTPRSRREDSRIARRPRTQGYSEPPKGPWVFDRNAGTRSRSPARSTLASSRSRAMGDRGDGASVVVGGRESRSHGEGKQASRSACSKEKRAVDTDHQADKAWLLDTQRKLYTWSQNRLHAVRCWRARCITKGARRVRERGPWRPLKETSVWRHGPTFTETTRWRPFRSRLGIQLDTSRLPTRWHTTLSGKPGAIQRAQQVQPQRL